MSTLKFVKFEKFAKNQQYLNLGPKMPYWAFLTKNTTFMYFWAKNFATILSYLISAAWNLSISKILQQKKKKTKFGTKNSCFGYFGTWIWKEIVIFEISTLWICLIAKFWLKKSLNLGTNILDLGISGQKFENNIVIFEVSTIKFS